MEHFSQLKVPSGSLSGPQATECTSGDQGKVGGSGLHISGPDRMWEEKERPRGSLSYYSCNPKNNAVRSCDDHHPHFTGEQLFPVHFEHAKITSTPGPLHLLFPVFSLLTSNLHKASKLMLSCHVTNYPQI